MVVVSPPEFDCHVTALDEASLAQTLAKRNKPVGARGGRCAVKKPDHRRGLLRARNPRRRRAAEPCAAQTRNELAPSHSITLSARRRNVSGMVSPIALAALRLMTSSNLIGNWTGNSFTLAPRSNRST